MRVDILSEGKVIGHSRIDPVDPGMSVASGLFVPSLNYEPHLHAYVIDERDNEIGQHADLTTRSDQFGILECVGVGIEDYQKALGERIVTILGIAHPQYETIFGAHPAYKLYYSGDRVHSRWYRFGRKVRNAGRRLLSFRNRKQH